MIGLLNLGSFILGLLALILPIINLLSYDKHKHWVILSVMSITACAISLGFQIFYHAHLVKIEDWSALMDITGTVALASAILLILTVILNVLTLILYRNRTSS